MKTIRTRVIVALASSAVLASGLSVVAVAASSATSGAVAVADGTTTGTSANPDATVYDT
jgi:ABC-type oligopeptide transport system substrate-binding subunit